MSALLSGPDGLDTVPRHSRTPQGLTGPQNADPGERTHCCWCHMCPAQATPATACARHADWLAEENP